MKKIFYALIIAVIGLFPFSPESAAQAHDFKENVKNGLRPSERTNQVLSLELTLSIDMERPDIVASGMGVPGEYDVDAAGNVYVVAFKNREDFIYKFDPKGRLIKSFGKFGQGPGELQWPLRPMVQENRLSVFDGQKKTLSVFDDQGQCLGEERVPWASSVEALTNGNYLIKSFIEGQISKEFYTMGLFLCDGKFRKIKELDRRVYSMDSSSFIPYFMWRSTPNFIYVINQDRGYEIWVFDLEGNPIRKITKAFKPVHAAGELIRLIMGPEAAKNRAASSRFLPDPMPPMSQIFVDDQDRVYAITYEKGESSGEYLIDIFDRRGVLISRKSFDLLWAKLYMGSHYTFGKNGYLYFYREKENGFNVLFKYKMLWKRISS